MRVQKTFTKPSRTQREYRDECDINKIIDKYRATGIIDHVREYRGEYADLPAQSDFHAAMTAITEASQAFDSLPARIRDRFGNQPDQFLAFVEDPENKDEMTRMGLIRNKYPEQPVSKSDPKTEPAQPVSSPAADGEGDPHS